MAPQQRKRSASKAKKSASAVARKGYTKVALKTKTGPQLQAIASRYGLKASTCRKMKYTKENMVKIIHAASNRLVSVKKVDGKNHISSAECSRALRMKSTASRKSVAPKRRRISAPRIKAFTRRVSARKRSAGKRKRSASKKPKRRVSAKKAVVAQKRRRSAKKPTLKKAIHGRVRKLSHMKTPALRQVAARKKLATSGKRAALQKRISKEEKRKSKK